MPRSLELRRASGRILQLPPRFKNGGEAGFPLPSTGRGIEGEGWADQAASPYHKHLGIPTPHPGPLPVEGEREMAARRGFTRRFKFTTVVLPRCARTAEAKLFFLGAGVRVGHEGPFFHVLAVTIITCPRLRRF